MKTGYVPFLTAVDDSKSDLELYQEAMSLADLVEPLGFDSLWNLEHHFTGYAMTPSPIQFLSYYAASTRRIQLGTAVIVLPWNDSGAEIAEEIAMLDVMSGGRTVFGFGRGAGSVEYDGFRVAMGEARERFVEIAEIVRLGLSRPRFSYLTASSTRFRKPRFGRGQFRIPRSAFTRPRSALSRLISWPKWVSG